MRKPTLVALLVASSFLSGCSFSTDLAVINLSDRPIEVRYRFKDTPGPFSPEKPATKKAAELDDDTIWQELPADQYVADANSRTLTVTVAPKTALLVDRVRGPGVPQADSFQLNEIVVRGAYGTIMLHGEQVRQSFVEGSRNVYAISYK